jgi:hypothetical protein
MRNICTASGAVCPGGGGGGGGTCAQCGGAGQPCCSARSCTGSGLACADNQICAQCGGAGQPCCAGRQCSGSGLACGDGTCVACGGPGQICCTGGSCNSGNCCDPTSVMCIAGNACPKGLCGTGGQFQVDKQCNVATDCAIGIHELNCCGSQIAIGYRAAHMADFTQSEMQWEAACAACGCSAAPLVAEDGKMCAQTAVTVTCDNNQRCTTACP